MHGGECQVKGHLSQEFSIRTTHESMNHLKNTTGRDLSMTHLTQIPNPVVNIITLWLISGLITLECHNTVQEEMGKKRVNFKGRKISKEQEPWLLMTLSDPQELLKFCLIEQCVIFVTKCYSKSCGSKDIFRISGYSVQTFLQTVLHSSGIVLVQGKKTLDRELLTVKTRGCHPPRPIGLQWLYHSAQSKPLGQSVFLPKISRWDNREDHAFILVLILF